MSRHKQFGPLKNKVKGAFERLLAAEHWSIRMENQTLNPVETFHVELFTVFPQIDQLFFCTRLPVIHGANTEASDDFQETGFGPEVPRSRGGDCQQRLCCGQFEVRFWGCRLFLKFSLSGN